MTERAIIYIDEGQFPIGHDDAPNAPTGLGWEIHVRREDGNIDLLIAAPSKHNHALWDLWNTETQESWGHFASPADVFMQALDPLHEIQRNQF